MQFFFYGSMSEGLVHFEKIRNFVVSKEDARILGRAYRLPVGYPTISLDGSDSIRGLLVRLQASDLLLGLLDQFHGYLPMDETKSLHHRRQVQVTTANSQDSCWVYAVNPLKLPKSAKLIENGDWLTSLQVEEPIPAKLTERQKNYLSKLNAISGREIVPIQDLSLYRELIKLELIVDKGRRLALSKLGHEVCRYLE